MAAWNIAFLFTVIFDPNCGLHSNPGICTGHMAIAQGAINIFFDIVLIVIPIPIILSLTLTTRQKVIVYLILALGSG